MQRKSKNDASWLTFDLLSDQPLQHGTFLRHGGVSSDHLDILNFGRVPGEREENVLKNISIAHELLGIQESYSGQQRHGKEIAEVTRAFLKRKEEKVCDALMTDEQGLGLMIKHADCQAAILYDPCHHAVAAVHAGWRGSVLNIYHETIEKMKVRYGTDPADLLVGSSPSLGPHHAEFRNYKLELPESFWAYQVKPLYFDFWEISRQQLMACGVLSHHIEIAGMCTYASREDCFSHRRDPRTGRHATLVALQKRHP
jgi:YfiH family protein